MTSALPERTLERDPGDSSAIQRYSAALRSIPREPHSYGSHMIRSLEIDGYRGLNRFVMNDMGRINLIVGKNNSRKTSILEALHLLSSSGDIQALWQICGRRGEHAAELLDPRYGEQGVDITHLFSGHEIHLGTKFTIRATDSPPRTITFAVREAKNEERAQAASANVEGLIRYPQLSLHIEGPGGTIRSVPLIQGSISFEYFEPPRRVTRRIQSTAHRSQFISTESRTANDLLGLWDKIALTPNETLVLRALQFLDDKIERIAGLGASPRFLGSRGGFIVKQTDYLFPFPIGSLGDGAWRMLAMAIAITQCTNGVLLVDEIDTGLHHSVMADMWRLIYATAKELDVQVFATTHSYDCVYALASICNADVETNSDVTIQRMETFRNHAVPYSEAEISAVAERKLDVG